MTELRHHRTPHWLNTRTRIGRLTLPQWIAVSLAFALGGLVYWGLGMVHALAGLGTLFLFGRIVVAGFIAGTLAALFYGLADDRREPFIRQVVTYPLRPHAYRYVSKQSQEVSCDAPSSHAAEGAFRRAPLAGAARRLAARACAHRPGERPRA